MVGEAVCGRLVWGVLHVGNPTVSLGTSVVSSFHSNFVPVHQKPKHFAQVAVVAILGLQTPSRTMQVLTHHSLTVLH